MALKITGKVSNLHEIPPEMFNTMQINALAVTHEKERQKSKAPTFALT